MPDRYGEPTDGEQRRAEDVREAIERGFFWEVSEVVAGEATFTFIDSEHDRYRVTITKESR
jgi:hypothetical protein